MDHIVHDIRETWTDEEWQAYYQEINEAEEEVENEMYEDIIDSELGI